MKLYCFCGHQMIHGKLGDHIREEHPKQAKLMENK
jgi:hypothetical protein